MEILLLLQVLILIIVLTETGCTLKEDWKQYKLDYNKTYASKLEDRARFRIFKMNSKEIRKHNRRFRRNLETYEKGINIFADLTAQEFEKRYGIFESDNIKVYESSGRKSHTFPAGASDVEYFDWREKGAVTLAKDQGRCGACWIFSAVGALEGYHFRKFGQLIPLSEQNLVDCFPDDTCMGGFPEQAIAFAKQRGINSAAEYPYKEKQSTCKPIESKYVNVTYEKLETIRNSEEDMKNALIRYGPLTVCMYVTNKWRFYKSGVWYDKECSEETNHAMLLVGFGRENGLDYWLIKNSFGRQWGDDGYIKVIRNKHENYCGITNESFYLI